MEEARSLGHRRVNAEYIPRRTSCEILAIAFQLVTEEKVPLAAETSSVQPERRKKFETLSHMEVRR